MFVKFAFKENTHPKCMNISLDYYLAEKPVIVDTLPPGAVANKQERIPDVPSLNKMFGEFNACHYDYYADCGNADKETIEKVLTALADACEGKLPQIDADVQYLTKNTNIVIDSFNFALKTVMENKNIDSKLLQDKVKKAVINEVTQHEDENFKQFFSSMMSFFDHSNPNSIQLKPEQEQKEPSSPRLN